MADTPRTFADFAKTTPEVLSAAAINTLIADDEFLSIIPLQLWRGGSQISWILNSTGPTVDYIDETTALYSSKGKRFKATSYLSQLGGEVEIPVFLDGTMGQNVAGWSEDVADLIRAFGQKLRSEAIKGNAMTEANVTVVPNVLGTPGIDAVTAVSANMPSGYGFIYYTHVGTTLKFRAPGSTTYGATTSIAAGDGDYTVADGDDTTKSVTLTIDASDFTAGAANMEGAMLLFQRPEEMAGLRELAALDSAQVKTPSTDGDAITLAMLDELDEMCLGPRNEKVFIMNARTRRAVTTLQRAAGGASVNDLKDNTAPNAARHNGIPLIASPGVAIDETQGASSTCGRVYCTRLNKEVGLSMLYGAQNGPNFGTFGSNTDDDINRNMALPLYVRKLGERENYATWKVRATGAFSPILARSKSCSMRYGVTS